MRHKAVEGIEHSSVFFFPLKIHSLCRTFPVKCMVNIFQCINYMPQLIIILIWCLKSYQNHWKPLINATETLQYSCYFAECFPFYKVKFSFGETLFINPLSTPESLYLMLVKVSLMEPCLQRRFLTEVTFSSTKIQ